VRDGDINCRIHNGGVTTSGAHGYQGPFKGKTAKGSETALQRLDAITRSGGGDAGSLPRVRPRQQP
jgi:hypothetical protein